ncbi:MAG: hypothetical protein JNK05_33030 [Myxococcales bacterium]|nr:hypothetical protein [Myxococcales bacterium]
MAARRHLPVLNTKAPSEPPSPEGDELGAAGDDAPAWHWIPLGMLATVLVSAVLAKMLWVPYASAQLASVGANPTREALVALQSKLALSGAAVGVLGTILGGMAVGALGNDKVNQRHGLLAGAGAMTLLALTSGARLGAGGLLSAALMVPIGAMAGYAGAVLGLRVKYALRARRAR